MAKRWLHAWNLCSLQMSSLQRQGTGFWLHEHLISGCNSCEQVDISWESGSFTKSCKNLTKERVTVRHSAFHKKKRLELGYLVATCCSHLLVKEVATNQLNQWEPQTVQCNALSPRMQSFNLENIWKNCVNKKTVLPQFYPLVPGFRVFSCSL